MMGRNRYNIGDVFKDMKLISYEKGKYTLQINACLSGRFKTHLGWKFEYID